MTISLIGAALVFLVMMGTFSLLHLALRLSGDGRGKGRGR